MDFRVEKKFLCNEKDYLILKSRLELLMQIDKNASENGYLIRSIYFDDCYNSCFYENEDGVDNRKKYRVRTYNFSEKVIKLECKSKIRGFTNKIATTISKSDLNSLTDDDDDDLFNFSENTLLNKVNLLKTQHLLRKSAIIEYDREAYTFDEGNVRVTFDKNIAVSNDFDNFFNQNMASIPILYTGQFILEVKFDEYLPKVIAEALELNNLQQTTFSKFYLGKKLLILQESGFYNEL